MMSDFKVGDRVRVIAYPKEIGHVVDFPRAGSVMIKLNRDSGGANHVICFEREIEPWA